MQGRALSASVGPFAGRGLFSGQPATLRIHPAPPGHGLGVRRVTFDQVVEASVHESLVTDDVAWANLPALPAGVQPRQVIRNTTLRIPPPAAAMVDARALTLATVEHALAALAGLGVWDAVLEVEGPEVPIFDGSARELCDALVRVLTPSGARGAPLVLRERVAVRDPRSGATIVGVPLDMPASQRPDIPDGWSYTLDFAGDSRRAHLRPSTATLPPGASPETFASTIAPARTFSFEDEARAAQAMGLFAGLTPADMLVLDGLGQPLAGALRFPDEPVRHKLLDLVGDMALLGAPLAAHVHATRSGHALAHEFCHAVRASLAS